MRAIPNCDCSWCNAVRKQEFIDNYMKITSYYFVAGLLFGIIIILLTECFIYFMLTGGI